MTAQPETTEYRPYLTPRIVPSEWVKSPERVTEEQIAELFEKAAAIDATNEAIYEERKQAMATIKKLIRSIWGDTVRKYTDGYNVAHYMGKQRVPRGDLKRATSYVQEFVDQKARLITDKEKERKEKEHKSEQDRRAKERLFNIHVMANKYGVSDPVYADAETVLDAIRRRDKYLDLAMAMEETRGDWSDGYYRVSAAMSRFRCETDTDREIIADLETCFNDEIDGRVFRDTLWNYGRIYDLVSDQSLVEDARLMYSYVWF